MCRAQLAVPHAKPPHNLRSTLAVLAVNSATLTTAAAAGTAASAVATATIAASTTAVIANHSTTIATASTATTTAAATRGAASAQALQGSKEHAPDPGPLADEQRALPVLEFSLAPA